MRRFRAGYSNELRLTLPGAVFARLEREARRSHHSVKEIALERLSGPTSNPHGLAEYRREEIEAYKKVIREMRDGFRVEDK